MANNKSVYMIVGDMLMQQSGVHIHMLYFCFVVAKMKVVKDEPSAGVKEARRSVLHYLCL